MEWPTKLTSYLLNNPGSALETVGLGARPGLAPGA
jgi:hypothetical protein